MAGYMQTWKSTEWETPQELFNELDKEFHFNLDPCASIDNYKCLEYYTKEDNGLNKEWRGSVFINPPFDEVDRWVEKAFYQLKNCDVIVMLLPARTDTRWFHNFIYGKFEVRFLKGRVKYRLNSKQTPAPFPSMVVIFKDINRKIVEK